MNESWLHESCWIESILLQVKILRHWYHHNNYKLCVASSGLLTHWMASFSGCVLCVYGTMQMSHLFWLPQNFNINIEGQMEEKSLGVILMGNGGSCWNKRKNLYRLFSRLRAVAAEWCTFDFVTFHGLMRHKQAVIERNWDRNIIVRKMDLMQPRFIASWNILSKYWQY